MKKGTENVYNCEYCIPKVQLEGHITTQHGKCNVCEIIYPSEKDLETHMISAHQRGVSKHSLAREPSFKRHKNKKYI